MRISTLFLFLCVFSSFASKTVSQNAKVNIKGSNLTIADFIDQVEGQTDYLFVYSKNEVNPEETLGINTGEKTVAQCLTEAFKGSDVKYAFENDYIVLTKNAIPSIAQQGKKVSGTVTDSNGEPVIGANVIIKGTTTGTITDFDGNFSLQVPDNAILHVSYIGFLSKEIPVGNQTTFAINLVEDTQLLDEVVVVGYGTMRKSDVTGSIASVKSSDILKTQSFSALDGLKGKASGVNIFSNSGQPGAEIRVLIRGVNTINASTNPLYVVDGVVMEDFRLLNPNDIENIEVLKDASSAAIYGARGANGVIMVTTKRGKKDGDGVTVSYQGSVTLSTIARKMETLSASQWQEAFMQGLANANTYHGTSYSLNMSDHFTDSRYFNSDGTAKYNTDWQDEATREAISHNHQLSIQQAGKNSSVGAFLNYTDQEGILLNSFMKRVNAKMTYDAKPKDWLSTSINVLVNHSWGNNTDHGDGGQNALRTMIEMPAWYPVKNADGSWADNNTAIFQEVVKQVDDPTTPDDESKVARFSAEDGANPVHFLKSVKRNQYRTQIFGNAALTFHILPDLDLKTQLGIDSHINTNREYGPSDVHDFGKGDQGKAYQSNSNTLYWQEETYLTYKKVLDVHRINAMLGLSWQERTYESFDATAKTFADDYYGYYNLGAGTQRPSVSSSHDRWAMNSYFLRLGYSYDDKYMATVTARYDGSSKFGKNNKYAFFPSVGLAWNISNEDFLKDNTLINTLKLHTSYGIMGNSEIGTYASLATIGQGTTVIGGETVTTAYLSKMANKDLKWEKTSQFDLGVNLGLFKDRLSFDVSYYRKYTSDLLYSRPLPYSTGFSDITANIGEVSNQGLDVMINAIPVTSRDFDWTSTLNMNYNKNKVEKLGANDETIWNNWGTLKVGESLSSFGGYEWLGIYDSGDQIGRSKIATEKTILGKGLPDLTGSFINNFRYKNFDLTLDFQFVLGVDVLQDFLHSTQSRFLTSGLSTILTDAWTPQNTNTDVQMIYNRQYGDGYSDQNFNSSWLADGSYLRLNLVQLGYSLKPETAKKLGLQNIRIYANVNNAFLLCSDDFKGYDPEASSKGTSQWGQNVMFFAYPKARTFSLGANITF
ncbi:TonB-dependent receptor [Massilibacteroides sp.]|uniref:TonB-dependent receptor n=1 Tax=Massilibacteroides sp. TaxID=2034766 RepID=UPI00260785D0|nr:TonB-dependent receptor [Massilibacteroides sp.]MDD4515065.1 TonB-dependent receptor [Massilibacteroides sp.]